MGWRDGCAPRPPVPADAEPAVFDFAAADRLGQRLDVVRRTVTADLDARAAAQTRLSDWSGGHRQAYDEHRSTQEAVLVGSDLAIQIARLRTAWDAATAAQLRANAATGDQPPQ